MEMFCLLDEWNDGYGKVHSWTALRKNINLSWSWILTHKPFVFNPYYLLMMDLNVLSLVSENW